MNKLKDIKAHMTLREHSTGIKAEVKATKDSVELYYEDILCFKSTGKDRYKEAERAEFRGDTLIESNVLFKDWNKKKLIKEAQAFRLYESRMRHLRKKLLEIFALSDKELLKKIKKIKVIFEKI